MDLSLNQILLQFQQFGPENWFDILLVTAIISITLYSIQGTRAIQVFRGFIVILILALILLYFVAISELEFTATSWLIEQILPGLFVAIPIIFQPELRRGLERLGSAVQRIMRLFQRNRIDPIVETVVQSCLRLSQRRHGALIVFEQDTKLQEYIETGVQIDAQPSAELLLTIFNKNTELHDGAVIIRDGRIVAAACVLILSNSNLSDRQMGLRHRAALGISEVSDAISLVVSEETGQFAITQNGRILRRQPPEQLVEILSAFIQKRSTTVS